MNDLLIEQSPINEQTLLASLAERPCACGKRAHGDNQEIVGECKHQTRLHEISPIQIVSAVFFCKVCGDKHKAMQIAPLE